MITNLRVEGMSCQMCVGHVTKALQDIEGVRKVEVDLENNHARIEHDGTDDDTLVSAVEEAGYTASVLF